MFPVSVYLHNTRMLFGWLSECCNDVAKMPNSNWHTISAIGIILSVACKSPILNSAIMFLAQYYMFAKMFRVFLACIGLGDMAKNKSLFFSLLNV